MGLTVEMCHLQRKKRAKSHNQPTGTRNKHAIVARQLLALRPSVIMFKDVLIKLKGHFREISSSSESEESCQAFSDPAGDVGREDLVFDVPVDGVGLRTGREAGVSPSEPITSNRTLRLQ